MWPGSPTDRRLVSLKRSCPDAPIGSMDLVLDPVHMKEIAKCGVAFLDSPTDIIPMTPAYLGLPPDSNYT